MVRTNWFFDEWTEAFGSERFTGGLLGRAAHHIHIHILNQYQSGMCISRLYSPIK